MEPVGRSGRSMIERKIVWREVCIPKRAAKRVPPLPQVARPMEVSCWQYRIVIFAQGRTRSGRRSVKILRSTSADCGRRICARREQAGHGDHHKGHLALFGGTDYEWRTMGESTGGSKMWDASR